MNTLIAYIGPGAGIAAAGTILITLGAVLVMFANLAAWPIRRIWRFFRLPRRGRQLFRRVLVIGLDGLDPRRVERLMREGRLPNFARIASQGSFGRLGSTNPPISPVAWSTFLTGVNPGKHGIFDFVARDPRTYLPKLSSAEVTAKFTGMGRRAHVRGLRRSTPFWKLLGQHGVRSTILRVPITFPPEPFDGTLLSAMCVPDLRGTQSSYTFLSTDVFETDESHSGGCWMPLVKMGENRWKGVVPGPQIDGKAEERRSLETDLGIEKTGDNQFVLSIGAERETLSLGELGPWMPVKFPIGKWRKLNGITRAQIRELENGGLSVYLTPLQIDPARPALPIGFPWIFPLYLNRLFGPYATLGLAEDTSALNDAVIDEETFLQLANDIHAERVAMALELMNHRSSGLFTCVFDGPDRIQHMFFGEESSPEGGGTGTQTTIDRMYADLDKLVGEVSHKVGKNDLLLVISDHGFTAFRRGIDLNRILEDEGLLVWKEESSEEAGFGAIDWSRTRAYAFGLSGIYLNLAGREAEGIVRTGEAGQLKKRIAERLRELRDPQTQSAAISEVYPADEVYRGPYAGEGPDLVVGYHEGYRVSWDCASGHRGDAVFTDNDRNWSGDHCVDRALVPGMILANRPFEKCSREEMQLVDLAPSILDWFGVEPPAYMDGKPFGFAGTPAR